MDINWIIGKRVNTREYMDTYWVGTVLGFDDDGFCYVKHDRLPGDDDSFKVEDILRGMIADPLDKAEWYNCYQKYKAEKRLEAIQKLRDNRIKEGDVCLVWRTNKESAYLRVVESISLSGKVVSGGVEHLNAQLVVSKEEADKLKQ